jgi:CheY-like chemotaxis protein
VAGDATQLRQVVMDLAANAAMAMQDRPGVMELSTNLVERGLAEQGPVEFHDVVTGRDLGPGHFVRLEVRDSGPGLPEDQRGRIFDPFYTTAPAGRGLGLASVVGVVRSHRGALAVTSEVGQGTTVSIDLPPATRAAEELLAASGQSPKAPRLKPAHILVVDDEAPVRKVAARMLEAAGHRVTTSADGYEALDIFGNDPGSFDLVLLDMTMPGISGLEALERIRQFRSAVPVLLTSGFNESEVTDVLAIDRACAFIHKPYGAVSLQRQVEGMLRRCGDARSQSRD